MRRKHPRCTLKIAYKEIMIQYLIDIIKTSEVMLTTLTNFEENEEKQLTYYQRMQRYACVEEIQPVNRISWLC